MPTCSAASGPATRRTSETSCARCPPRLPTPGFASPLRRGGPDLVPDGVEALELPTRSQELRMAWTLPRALRRLGAGLVHTQYAVPLRCPCPAVVTIHDLSFEGDASHGHPRPSRVQAGRPTRRSSGRSRADRLRAHEARSRRALRPRARACRRDPERRRSCVPAGRREPFETSAVRPRRRSDPGAKEPAGGARRSP